MKKVFERFLFGGDYNPNQWPQEIWQEDMRIFRNAHINSATINVFSWAKSNLQSTIITLLFFFLIFFFFFFF